MVRYEHDVVQLRNQTYHMEFSFELHSVSHYEKWLLVWPITEAPLPPPYPLRRTLVAVRLRMLQPAFLPSQGRACRQPEEPILRRGKPLSRQSLSQWVVEAVILAYENCVWHPLGSLWAHSTRGMDTSWDLSRDISVSDTCGTTSWASPHTFIQFYCVTSPSLAHSVLGVGSL